MGLDMWCKDDIRNVLLAANAANGEIARRAIEAESLEEQPRLELAAYRSGYEAAIITVAAAFGIPLADARGRFRAPGIAIPAARLSVSYRAQKAMEQLLEGREEW